MRVGDKKLTTNPSFSLKGDEGEFRVTDHFGKVDRYLCSDVEVIRIVKEGFVKEHTIPFGLYLLEKLADGSGAPPEASDRMESGRDNW